MRFPQQHQIASKLVAFASEDEENKLSDVERLNKLYRQAKRISTIGTICLYVISGLVLLIAVGLFYAFLQTNDFSNENLVWKVLTCAESFAELLSIALMGTFLRHHGHERSPFGPRQSRRLFISGCLYVLKRVFSYLTAGPVHAVEIAPSITATTGLTPHISLLDIALIVFLLCLGMMVRYGDALKKDSDSIA